MKRIKKVAKLGLGPLCAAAALVITLALAGYFAESGVGLAAAAAQEPSPSASAQAAETRPPNPPAKAADPNSPMTVRQGEELLTELRAIRILLQNDAARPVGAPGAPAPQNLKMKVEVGWDALGHADAPVTIVEFMDLQCPFCRRFQTTTFAQLRKSYIDTGKVRLIARDLALPMHPYALPAAEAAHCAGDQGKFWQLRDAILSASEPPTADVILEQATNLGLDVPSLRTCLDSGKYKGEVEKEHDGATALGIRGTPAFVIGRVVDGWLDGVVMSGARPYETFQQQIDKALAAMAQGKVTPTAQQGPPALNQ